MELASVAAPMPCRLDLRTRWFVARVDLDQVNPEVGAVQRARARDDLSALKVLRRLLRV
jgi:hypothetical protein